MKRILLLLLAFFYMGIAQGAEVYFHYCMGELVELGLTKTNPPSCDFCGMTANEAKEKTCCKQDSKTLKVDNIQKMATSHFHFEQAPVILLKNIIWEARNLAIPIELGKGSLSHAPPKVQDVPVFIRNCTYRI
ncbi:glutaredoxin [Pedobacter sp. CAN_A7]|uniref:HYC_CC_PP family protein n=1 Tax=Pedobacter sp. CAN_A7 TaxID=2787722 RepID=UPI0018C9E118